MTIKGKIDLAFLALLVIIVAGFWFTYQSNQRLNEIYTFSEDAQDINHHLNEILIDILNIESGQRGYVLSGRKAFLQSYEEGKALLPANLDTLEKRIGEKPVYRTAYPKFRQFIELKIALNDSAVRLKTAGRHAAASDIIATGYGKELMDSIKLYHGKIENSVIRLIKHEDAEKIEGQSNSFLNLGSLAIIILSSLVIGYLILRRNAKHLLEYQEKQKALINELNARNAQLDDFAHIVSHNLRSSSSNIAGLVGMIDDRNSADDNKEIFTMLKKVSVNLTETLNDILGTLAMKGGADLPRETLLFHDVVSRVIDSMSADIINSKTEIIMDFRQAEHLTYPKIYLESILHNLISNAIKYADPSRSPIITLTTYRRNGRTVLAVSDNGMGINLKLHGNKLFRYKQIFHEHPQAKGIGLFMIRNQIELLGGSVHVKSEPGKGTTFEVTF